MLDQNIQFYDDIAPFYDILLNKREDEFSFYRHIADPSHHILEVACGSGSLSQILMERCKTLTGVDRAEQMLDIARQRLPNGTFLCGDMRDFDLNQTFDCVICPYNSLMHLTNHHDALSAVKRLAAHCQPGGQVVIALTNVVPAMPSMCLTDVLFRTFEDPTTDNTYHAYENSDYNAETAMFSTHWTIKDVHNQSVIAESFSTMKQHSAEQVEAMCKKAGLRITVKYGDYARTPFVPMSPYQIIFATPQ